MWKVVANSLAGAALLSASAGAQPAAEQLAADWPSYNRTLAGSRYSPLEQINQSNVSRLAVKCMYDTGLTLSFQTGPVVANGVMYFTTEKDIFAIDAATCAERWRTTENYAAEGPLKVNRGAALSEGRLFRGTQDGRVLAYDAATGKRLWDTRITVAGSGETVPAAPVAWNGLVFIGNAGGDIKAVRGRMYALDAATGRIVWQVDLAPGTKTAPLGSIQAGYDAISRPTWGNAPGVPVTGAATWTSYTVDPATGLLYVPAGNPAPDFNPELRPGLNLFANSLVVIDARTGAYRRHFHLVPNDFHDWDVSAAPIVISTRADRSLMAWAGKDGHLFGFDLATGRRLYRAQVTTIANAEARIAQEGTRFCPGVQGGNEWNGPAYSSRTNLVYTGTVDWCSTVKGSSAAEMLAIADGENWASAEPEKPFGSMDPPSRASGWLNAHDADTGRRAWRVKAAGPVLAGVTPTAGGLVFYADMRGTIFALHEGTGKTLWSARPGGGIGGGLVSYAAGGRQHIAVAVGMTSRIWPVQGGTARIVVYALPNQGR